MTDRNDWNARIIEEFRANHGKIGGQVRRGPDPPSDQQGAKSGLPRTSPMMYLADGDRFLVFASKAGAPTNPDWYHNLVANPHASVEVGDDTFEVSAAVLKGEERDRVLRQTSNTVSRVSRVRAKDQPYHPGCGAGEDSLASQTRRPTPRSGH